MVRILDARAVARLLTPSVALNCMQRLYTLAADPGATGLARTELHHPRGWLRSLPGFIAPEGVLTGP